MKSLVELIDETLAEVEELKKSDRFSASEIKLDGPGSGIAGKDPNGSLGKGEDKEDDEDEDEEDDDMEKAEGKNREADPNGGKHMAKADDKDEEDEDEEEDDDKDDEKKPPFMKKAEGKNREADPNGGKHLAKSLAQQEVLMKSYVDERLSPIEDQLKNIAGMVEKMFKTPVSARGQSYKHVSPLIKSEDAGEPLSKSQVVEKLFALKKSGTPVDSTDIASAELGGPAELAKVAQKYQIK